MKAAQLNDYGPAENFEIVELPDPEAGPGEVLVRVEYAGLRWGDIMGRNGIPVKRRTPPFVPGQEAAGEIAAVGQGVTRFKPGDRVVVLPQGNAYQQLVAVPEAGVRPIPDGIPTEAPLIYVVNMPTAHLAIYEWAKVQEGEIVLVHAAAGGVGSLAVQILKRKFDDVTVIGLAGSDEKVELVTAHGADHAINYKTTNYIEAVGEIAGVKPRGFRPDALPAGVHVSLNGVGGPTLRTDRAVIRRFGRWVIYGSTAGMEPVNLYANSYDSITIMPFSKIPYRGTPPDQAAEAFTDEWLRTEQLDSPTIHPIEDIANVQAAMERGETAGKVLFRL